LPCAVAAPLHHPRRTRTLHLNPFERVVANEQLVTLVWMSSVALTSQNASASPNPVVFGNAPFPPAIQLYVPDLFLRKGFPRLYEGVLRLPVIRSIRQQEHETLRCAFDENLRTGDDVLEVGAGTGYYTFEIAAIVRSVVALERAPGMTRILRQRIADSAARNISVVESEFLSYAPEPARKFDAVAAIGVLDSVIDWRPFLDRCIALAARRVVLTVPRSSFWARIHSFFGGMVGVDVRVYDPDEFARHLGGRRFHLRETGLQTRWTHGLTLVAVIETDNL
jgi:SAM-dependent methyltransferase